MFIVFIKMGKFGDLTNFTEDCHIYQPILKLCDGPNVIDIVATPRHQIKKPPLRYNDLFAKFNTHQSFLLYGSIQQNI